MQADATEDGFASTHWSLVAQAHGDDAAAHASLLSLCLRYWYPVYAYLRRSGHAPERAHDLARGFFRTLIRSVDARDAANRYGRFRLFLLAELHRFLSIDHVPTDGSGAIAGPTLAELEGRLRGEATPAIDSPERMLRRGFAVEILGVAHQRLRQEALGAGRLPMFEALERYLGAEPRPGDYEAIARKIGVRPLFVAMAVKRLRQRFRELVDRELGNTLASAEDLQVEREVLLRALDQGPA